AVSRGLQFRPGQFRTVKCLNGLVKVLGRRADGMQTEDSKLTQLGRHLDFTCTSDKKGGTPIFICFQNRFLCSSTEYAVQSTQYAGFSTQYAVIWAPHSKLRAAYSVFAILC